MVFTITKKKICIYCISFTLYSLLLTSFWYLSEFHYSIDSSWKKGKIQLLHYEKSMKMNEIQGLRSLTMLKNTSSTTSLSIINNSSSPIISIYNNRDNNDNIKKEVLSLSNNSKDLKEMQLKVNEQMNIIKNPSPSPSPPPSPLPPQEEEEEEEEEEEKNIIKDLKEQRTTTAIKIRDIKDLKEKINKTKSTNKDNYLATATEDICIVTAFTEPTQKEFFPYNDYRQIIPVTTSNMWEYAKLHGYRLYMFNEDSFDSNKKASWVKINLFRKYFNNCTWVMYTDVDWLFKTTDPIPIDNNYDMIVSNECIKGKEWKKMSGTMVLKNSDWSREFLNKWENLYEKYKNVVNHDQMAFLDLMRVTPKEVKVLPPEQFMTYDTSRCNISPKFGIHFPGPNKHKRVPDTVSKLNIETNTEYTVMTVANIASKYILYQAPYQMKSSNNMKISFESDKDKRMSMRSLYSDENVYFISGKEHGAFDYNEFYKYNDMIFIDLEESYKGETNLSEYKTQVFLHIMKTHVSQNNMMGAPKINNVDDVGMIMVQYDDKVPLT